MRQTTHAFAEPPDRPSAAPTAEASTEPPATAPPAAPAISLQLLALAGFASMASMRLCDAMLPALARDFAADGAGTGAQAAGAVSAFAIAYGLMQLVYGPLGDRFGKARVIGLAALACSLAAAAAALAPTLGSLVVCRALMGGTAAGVIPLVMAWVGDHVPWAERQVALARMLTYTVTGMMAGGWAGGALADTLGWRWAFVAVGLALATVGLRISLRVPRGEGHGPAGASTLRRLRQVLAGTWARRLYLVSALEGGLVFGVIAFIPSLLHERFGLTLGRAGAILALFGLGGLVYTRIAAGLLARHGAPAVAAAGGALLGAGFLTLAATPHWALTLPACLAAGLGFYMLHGTLQTCATQVSTTARGTAVSLFACVLFMGQSLGIWAMARVMQSGAAGDAFAPRSAMAAAGLALALLAWRFAAWMKAGRHEAPAVAA